MTVLSTVFPVSSKLVWTTMECANSFIKNPQIWQRNLSEVKLKLLVFFLVPLVMQKVQKVESVNIQSDWETKRKKRIDLSCVFTHSGKVWKGGSVNTQNDFETASKKWADRKKRMICKSD